MMKRYRISALPEWLGMSHMLVLGGCWMQAYFEERPIFGRKDQFWEHVQQLARKQHAEKEEKKHARGEACKARRQENLTTIGLGFLTKVVTTISLENSINKNLGGLCEDSIFVDSADISLVGGSSAIVVIRL